MKNTSRFGLQSSVGSPTDIRGVISFQQTTMSPYDSANGRANGGSTSATFNVKAGLAKMLKGGVIMDVVNVEQAKIAEAAGAVAVMALERIPADIRYDGGVARMSDPEMIKSIKEAVTIPVMAKVGSSEIPWRFVGLCFYGSFLFHHCY